MSHVPNQQSLGHVIKQLFPNSKIVGNARKAANVASPSGLYFEIDFWLPELRLGFEYQDPHHYISTGYRLADPKHTIARDSLKKKLVDDKGDTLVVVPCWWDTSIDSLKATIKLQRPEMFPDLDKSIKPIPTEVPAGFFKKNEIPGIGELMLASFAADKHVSTKLWWISEKYDGRRFCWNPNTKTLYSKGARYLHVSQKYTSTFPDVFIDGELWCGRDSFTELQGTYTQNTKREESASSVSPAPFLRFVAFDNPNKATRELAYEKRFATLLERTPANHLTLIITTSCKSPYKKFLENLISYVIENGGEGVIAREPGSAYVSGMTDSLFKFKAERDQEGLVVGVDNDVYTLKLPDDTLIEVEETAEHKEEEREEEEEKEREGAEKEEPEEESEEEGRKYELGEIVTFTFSHFDKYGNPARPKLQRKRTDVTWPEVVENFRLGRPAKKSLSESTQRVLGPLDLTRRPAGHWTMDGSKNIRTFLDDLAHSWKKDPLDPETWYKFNLEELSKAKGISLRRHFSSIPKMLMNIYPNIGLDELKFPRVTHNYWGSEINRKSFFDNFAKKKGFDPLVAENWYSVSRTSVEREKGAYVLQQGGYLVRTLQSLYPNIGLDPLKFQFSKKWQGDEKMHRNFFEKFAKTKGFDPLVPWFWYTVMRTELLDVKGAYTVLSAYNGSVKKALLACFPDIGFVESKFNIVRPRFWMATENRRDFFDEFAENMGFDPLVPTNWYSVTVSDISLHGGKHILLYCGHSLSRALLDAYPDIGLEPTAFNTIRKRHWEELVNRRKYLDSFAEQRGFDPLVPENWYPFVAEDFLKEKEGAKFLNAFDNSAVTAIMATYPNIGLKEFNFSTYTRHFWANSENLRRFFNEFAKSKNFDPQIAQNWYSVVPDDVRNETKGGSVLQRYGGSFVKALQTGYPEIHFEEHKFIPTRVWVDVPGNRKKFLDNFAQKHTFDPLLAAKWKLVSIRAVAKEPRGRKFLRYYNGSLVKALMEVYSFKKIE